VKAMPPLNEGYNRPEHLRMAITGSVWNTVVYLPVGFLHSYTLYVRL